jgi:uncharacterized protein DUF2442
MTQMVRIQSVEALEPFHVRLEFTNDSTREVDLAVYLRGPVFERIRNDPAVFRSVRVDPELGTIVWPNGADIDPDVLYHGLKPAWMEEEMAADDRATQIGGERS